MIYKTRKTTKEEEKFLGFNLGAGLMASFDLGDKKRVQKATLVNGVVRVEEENTASIGVIAEVHKLRALRAAPARGGLGLMPVSFYPATIMSLTLRPWE